MYSCISCKLFYALIAHFRLKQLSISYFAIVAEDGRFWFNFVASPQLICNATRAWDTAIVTTYSSAVLARPNWRKGDLH